MAVGLLFGVPLLAMAGYLFFTGGRDFYSLYQIRGNDPTPIRELEGSSGPVEVEGTAITDEDDETVTAPFTGTDCLAYSYEVAEERRNIGGVPKSYWHPIKSGMDGVDFQVDDTTGRVRVTPKGADLQLEDHTTVVSAGDDPPKQIERYLQEDDQVDKKDKTTGLLGKEVNVGNKQRFIERRLDVGESVYVYGQATRDTTPDWGSDRVTVSIGSGDRTPIFVISDTDEGGTTWQFRTDGLRKVVRLQS